MRSPQTSAAVVLLIENNAAQDKKAKDLWQAVDDAKATLDDRRATRDVARGAFGKLKREHDARSALISPHSTRSTGQGGLCDRFRTR